MGLLGGMLVGGGIVPLPLCSLWFFLSSSVVVPVVSEVVSVVVGSGSGGIVGTVGTSSVVVGIGSVGTVIVGSVRVKLVHLAK